MTLEEANVSLERLREVRDRPLEVAYEVHDIGQEALIARLEAHGYHVEEHGDDARHADAVYYGDGPDLAVYDEDGGTLLGYIEIKCKESPEWFGRVNLRHYHEYVNFDNETEVPVFLWFGLVAEDSDVIHREAFCKVEDTDQIDGDVVDVSEETVVFHSEDVTEIDEDLCAVAGSDIVEVRPSDTVVDFIPEVHGNDVIELNDDQFRSFAYFTHVLEA